MMETMASSLRRKGFLAFGAMLTPLMTPADTLHGEVFYLTRNALPASAHLKVSIIDASRADAKADVVTYKEIATGGRQVPLAFTLDYQPNSLVAGHRYQVEAAIFDGDRLLYRNTTAIPLPNPNDTPLLRIKVDPIPQTTTNTGDPSGPVTTEPGTTYYLTELLGKPVPSFSGTRRLYLNLDSEKGQFSGFSGVNRFGGQYTRTGYKIKFGDTRSSMMAGPAELMNLERDFQSIFTKATSAKTFGEFLVIYQGNQVIFKGTTKNQ